MLNPAFPDLRGEHRTEPVPPEPHRLVTDIDAAFVQQIFDLAQRQRVADIHHHREADDLGRRVEIAERIFHPRRLRTGLASLKPIWSDSAFGENATDSVVKVLVVYAGADGSQTVLPASE